MASKLTHSQTGPAQTIVFYDGGCALCSREIQHYSRLDRQRRIEWLDINRETTLLNAFGVTFDQAMRRLHVLDRNGVLVHGVRAFAALWSELPYYRVVSRLLYSTRAIRLIEPLYARFALWRYNRRLKSDFCYESCQDGYAQHRGSS